jgi:hypothetical protein
MVVIVEAGEVRVRMRVMVVIAGGMRVRTVRVLVREVARRARCGRDAGGLVGYVGSRLGAVGIGAASPTEPAERDRRDQRNPSA